MCAGCVSAIACVDTAVVVNTSVLAGISEVKTTVRAPPGCATVAVNETVCCGNVCVRNTVVVLAREVLCVPAWVSPGGVVVNVLLFAT